MIIKKFKFIFAIIFVFCFLSLNLSVLNAFSLAQSVQIDNISKIISVGGKWHFTIILNKDLANEYTVDVHHQETVSKNIYINGKSVYEINNEGKDFYGNSLKNGILINIGKNEGEKYFGLHVFINPMLSPAEYGIKNDDTDVLEIKNGFYYNGVGVNENLVAVYYASVESWNWNDDYFYGSEELNILYISDIIRYEESAMTYFYIRFKEEPVNKPFSFAHYNSLINNIEVNGIPLSVMMANTAHEDIYIHYQTSHMFNGYGLFIYFKDASLAKYPFKANESNTLLFKKGFKTPSLSTLKHDIEYVYDYDQQFWVIANPPKNDYYEIEVRDVSSIMTDDHGNAFFLIYFNKDVSVRYMPFVSGSISWLRSVSNSSDAPFYYSEAVLQGIMYDNIRNSVVDYIKINGKTIREMMQAESGFKDTSVMVHYTGGTFDPKAIQIVLSIEGDNKYIPGTHYTLEILKGFKTPLYGELSETYYYDFTKRELTTQSNNNNDIEEQEKGCKATAMNSYVFLAAFLIIAIKNKQDKGII